MAPSLAAQLVTLSIIALQRQTYHNRRLNLPSWNGTYDFVVVGAGTAGSIVAGRLSENPRVTVLLIEAGGPMGISNDIMEAFWMLSPSWNYISTPQKYAGFNHENHQLPILRGRIVGGSHTINNILYTRGNRRDFDDWASTYGANGWNYESVLPFFLKTENNTDPAVVAANPHLHSTSGPLEVSTVPNPDPIFGRWVNGTMALGWPKVDFAQMENQFGTTLMQTTQSATNWTRQTTFAAFIEVNIARPNLHVLVNSQVTRLLFSSDSSSLPTVTGVEFTRNGQLHNVSASREVILSGGVYNSPQLLMLAGIGPREHLSQIGIPLRVDLPVGSTLYDHVTAFSDFYVKNPSDVGWSGTQYFNFNAENLYQFFVNATGPLTRQPVTETYVGTGINGDRSWPDGLLWLQLGQVLSSKFDSLLDAFDPMQRDQWRQYYRPFVDNNQHIFLGATLLRPLSSGTVRLASKDPLQAPLIDYNFFSNRQDLVAITRLLSTMMKIVESPVMSPYLAYSSQPVPGCTFCSDGRPLSQCTPYLTCVAQTYTTVMNHPTSTCPMGNATSSAAVVDEHLRVRGVARLRVIDASVMPKVVNTNTNAATMMIAEKSIHLLREEYGIL